jgi:hypothetical protein
MQAETFTVSSAPNRQKHDQGLTAPTEVVTPAKAGAAAFLFLSENVV